MALALALSRCSAPERPPLALESAHFRLHAYPDDWICPRLGEMLERHYAALSAYLDVRLPSGEKIDIYKFRNADELGAHGPCPAGAHVGGCAGDREVYVTTVTSAPFEHELVHAYAALSGEAPLLFEEGLATMLQDWDGLGIGEKPHSYASTPLENVMESADWSRTPDRSYAAAASFTRSLVDRHGIAAFRKFHSRTPRDSSLAGIDANMQLAFGESLAEALLAWRDGPAKSGWLPVSRCAAEALPAGENTELGELSCGRARRSFALAQPGGLVVRTRHDRMVSASIHPCSGERSMWPSDWSIFTGVPDEGEQRELWASLPAGSYYLEAGASALHADSVQPLIALEWSATAADRCEDALERAIPADTRRVDVPLSYADLGDHGGDAGLHDAFVRIRIDAPQRLAVGVSPADVFAAAAFDDGAEHRTRRWICSGGCPPSACTEVTGSAPVELSAGAHVLMLEGSPTDRRTFELSFE